MHRTFQEALTNDTKLNSSSNSPRDYKKSLPSIKKHADSEFKNPIKQISGAPNSSTRGSQVPYRFVDPRLDPFGNSFNQYWSSLLPYRLPQYGSQLNKRKILVKKLQVGVYAVRNSM